MSSLAGRVALITGASRGIGASIARHLASRGATVAITYSSPDPSTADALLSSLPAASPGHLAIRSDASSPSTQPALVADVVSKLGRLDIVILNAGIMPLSTLSSTTPELFQKVLDANVTGPYFLVQAAAPHLPDNAGRIVFLSTSQAAANSVTPEYTLYIASKGAIEQMARGLNKEFAKRGITVNVVSPGPTATDLFLKGKSEEVVQRISGMNPRGRIGTPEEVAEAVGMFVGEEGRWVSGQNLRVNGGWA